MTASSIEKSTTLLFFSCVFFLLLQCHTLVSMQESPNHMVEGDAQQGRIIRDIVIEGNHNVSADAILNKVTYHRGELYTPLKSKSVINNLMNMG